MKCFSTAMCGFLMALPMTAASVYAQSTTAPAPGAHTSTPSATTHASTAQAPSAAAAATPRDPNAPPPPAHPITTEQTRELLNLMGYKKIQDGSWTQMIAMNKQAAPFIPDNVWTDVQSGVTGIDYVALIQPVYAKYMSTEDAAKALEFYRTPAGKRVLESMPTMLGESAAVSQQKGRQVGREAIEKHRPEIEAAQKKYQAEHAPAGGEPTLGPGAPPAGSSAAPSSGPATSPAPAPPVQPKPQQ